MLHTKGNTLHENKLDAAFLLHNLKKLKKKGNKALGRYVQPPKKKGMDFYTLHIKVLLSDKDGLLNLINQGAELNRLDLIGNSPLHLAVLCNDMAVVNMLLKAGANPNVTSREGLTPTQKATQLGYSAIKYLLVSFGGHASSNNLSQVSKSALYN